MDGKSLNITNQKIEELKALFPDVFTEGKIDFDRLKAALGEDVFVNGEHYELSWAGKTEARKEIQKQTTATLIPDREGSIDFDTAQNIFIEGENLEVLRALQKSYFGKVKMIYIDPPYNTGNDSFVYPDDYTERRDAYNKRTGITDDAGYLNKQDLWRKNSRENGQFHSVWLSMMYPRLYLARNLMCEDGVIFVSIDDNEQGNLKLLMDDVFGEENFISEFPRITKKAGKTTDTVAKNNDYLLCYRKSEKTIFNPYTHTDSGYKHTDTFEKERGKYKLSQTLDYGSIQYSPSLDYEIEIGGQILRPGNVSKEDMEERKLLNPKSDFCWRWSKKLYEFGLKNDFIVLKESREGYRIYTKTYENATISEDRNGYFVEIIERTKSVTSLEFIDNEYSNDNSRKDLDKIFESKVFDYSKPVSLIKTLAYLATNANDIILDFFAGSSTTAQSMLELNEYEGGNRRFILIQMPEPIEENHEAKRAGYKIISDISKVRIKKVIEKLKKERESKLDFDQNNKQHLGFKAYKISPSNFKIWRNDIEGKETLLEQLQIFTQAEKSDSVNENMLHELILKAGLPLTVSVEEMQAALSTVYNVDNNKLFVFFDKLTPEFTSMCLALQPAKVICLNSCFDKDEELTNFKLQLKDSGIELTII